MAVAFMAHGLSAVAFPAAFSAAIKPPANTQHVRTRTSRTIRVFMPGPPSVLWLRDHAVAPRRGCSGYTVAGDFPAEILALEKLPQGRDRDASRERFHGLPRTAKLDGDELDIRGLRRREEKRAGRRTSLDRASHGRLQSGIPDEEGERGETVLRLPRRQGGHASLGRAGRDQGDLDGGSIPDGEERRSIPFRCQI